MAARNGLHLPHKGRWRCVNCMLPALAKKRKLLAKSWLVDAAIELHDSGAADRLGGALRQLRDQEALRTTDVGAPHRRAGLVQLEPRAAAGRALGP